MSLKNHTLFFWTSLHGSLESGTTGKRNPFRLDKRKLLLQKNGLCSCTCCVSPKRCRLVSQALRFSSFSGQKNVGLLGKDVILRSESRLECAREPYFRGESLVSYLTPLWEEGLFLIRASVYTAVIAGQSVSTFSVTCVWQGSADFAVEHHVESCSFGPHKEEFSCGEAPTVKLRLRPFVSLRRGKLVIDAVLLHPSFLVVQRKDFTWLGIPFNEGGRERSFSAEEGIDYRTRTRRLAREEAFAQWERERDGAAREAAEVGYFVSERSCGLSKGDDGLKEIETRSLESTESAPFFCMNDGKHDHWLMDKGVNYDTKHTALEKSFGVRFPGLGLRFWSRVISGLRKHKLNRKANGSNIFASGGAIKKIILERSASAAHAYFCDQPQWKFEEPSSPSESYGFMSHDMHLVKSEVDRNTISVIVSDENRSDDNQSGTQFKDLGFQSPLVNENVSSQSDYLKFVCDSTLRTRESEIENLQSSDDVAKPANPNSSTVKNEEFVPYVAENQIDDNDSSSGGQQGLPSEDLGIVKPEPQLATYFQNPFEHLLVKFGLTSFLKNIEELISHFLSGSIEMLKSDVGLKVEDIVSEHVDGVDFVQSEGVTKTLPVTLDSVHFRGATLMLLAYGDKEVREMENVNGNVKFQNHYSRIHVDLSGNCNTWRSDIISEDGGWLSANVFVDTIEQNWHANLKIDNLFVPLFERILEIPITWSKGWASGEVHLCMSKGETFPNFHGQLDVRGLDFQLLDAPSSFSNISASLCFRGQRIFLHNASGWFGSVPLEASGDFGIHPEEGEFHLMCQVPGVEVNALMRTFKMKPLLFPLAGSVTALFNCQGPLDTPVFVGTGMVSRTFSYLQTESTASVASEALATSKEAGALAAFDRVPFSYVSANFTFNTDNCVADLYGIRACLVDGGEIRGAGNAWICPELDASGRTDESLAVEFVGPLQPSSEDGLQSGKLLSISLQKGQLRANICFQPFHSANLEVRHFPLDELELASLRGTIQRAEIQLNLQKRRGHGVLSVLQPKFSGVLGEALDVAARWSGDVITIEKTVLQQNYSCYELQGEYVLPGTRDRNPIDKGGLIKRLMSGHIGNAISSMGRWRMKLEVRRAEVAEMLPLARLLSRSMDPAVQSRSKDFFMQSLQSVGLYTESLQQLLETVRGLHAPSNDVVLEDLSLPGLSELKGHWHGSLDASGGGNGDTLAEFDFHGEDWEWGDYKTQRVLAVGAYSNDDGMYLERIFIQKDNATIHADGTLLGPKTNLHFAVLNFPVSLVPTVVQIIESTAMDVVHSLRQLLAPIKGILHMEGDLRGSLAKPECDVQVRLLDGSVGGVDLGRAEVVASLTSTSRFLFNAKFEPTTQNGHVLIQGSIPVAFVQNNTLQEDVELDKSQVTWVPDWVKEKNRGTVDDASDKKVSRDRNEEGWNTQLAESLKGLNWQILDDGEVRIDADIKDGGMTLVTALSPHVNWLHGNADLKLEVRGTVDQPVLNGHASFHRASISSPVLQKPLTNFGGNVHVQSNRLCITSLESRVSRKGKLLVKGNLPLRTSEAAPDDKIELKCEVLEVRAQKVLSGQVDSQLQITGSILQPNISGNIKISQGEAYLPHDRGGTPASNRFPSNQSVLPTAGVSRMFASRYVSRFLNSESASSREKVSQSSGSVPVNKSTQVEKQMEQVQIKPNVEICLNDLKLVLGPELKIVYPLILNFGVSGELELNGPAHPKWIKPRGILTFENGEVDLVATQVRLKREHLNIAKFEPEYGLDPMLDLALVGSEWQFRIQGRASNWKDKLVVTSTRSVEQDALSPTEAARRFESQLAESILEGNGQLAFEKLATATLEKLMPRIEGKGEFGQARWRLVYAPQIPSLVSVDPTADPLKSLASNISFGTEVEVQLGKRLQATIVRQMKESEMAMQWTLSYLLTSRLRVLLQSAASKRLLFEYSATSQD
uniref:Translocation and assembly module TamB C-terminal domain-containing protein n=1 Tax=Glycine max TaxID=3847 RepID=A0A368UGS4_SOYBN